MGKASRAGGCLRAVLVLALLGTMAVLGYRAIVSHIGRTDGGDGASGSMSEFIPQKEGYTPVRMSETDICKGDLILINRDAPYRFTEDKELSSLYDYKNDTYKVKDKNVTLDTRIIDSLNQLMGGFYAEHHIHDINVLSGYRSYEYQESLLRNEITEKGEAEAYRWVARPGSSEHHTGLAFDVCFYDDGERADYDGTGDFAWINQNAYRYGFIVRYQEDKAAVTGISHEPWHFRYVGIPHAYVMKQEGFCYEEYIDFLREYRYGDTHLLVTYGGRSWEIYYTEDTEVPVPKDKGYSISGNNVDGFIVTAAY